MTLPYQLVPSATNEMMSRRLAVAVIVGAVPPLNLTPVNVPVKLPAPVLSRRIKDFPAVAVGMVNVQFPVSVAVCSVPDVKAMVFDVPVFPMATTDSV